MADPILLAYGKGQMPGFAADGDGVLDLIPVDMVVNCMLAAMVRHVRDYDQDHHVDKHEHVEEEEEEETDLPDIPVYHVATSHANPLNTARFAGHVTDHFRRVPFVTKAGNAVIVPDMRVFPSPASFMWYAWRSYAFPGLVGDLIEKWRARWVAATPSRGVPGEDDGRGANPERLKRRGRGERGGRGSTSPTRKKLLVAKKTYEQLRYMSSIYSAYTFYACRFRADGVRSLWAELSEEDQQRFPFDLESIDWDYYVDQVHIPGLRKYVLKNRNVVS
jgi:alcohol-forming fatty acyl-CoA reductase